MKRYALLFTLLLFVKCANTNEVVLWSGGEIQYCYANSFTASEQKVIEYAMSEWTKSGSVSFKPVKCEISVLAIYRSPEINYATFGSQELPHMYLHQITYSVVAHELGHVIGLMHEHQRPDRDSYITVNYDNVLEKFHDQFYKLTANYWEYDYKKYAYDYNSIMHYGKYDFTSNGKLTIVSPVPINNSKISDMDYEKVKDMYTCDIYQD